MSLRQKTLNGLFWSFLSQAGRQLCQFVITAILARLLSPADFGLIGMAAVFTGFAMVVGELGVGPALIQRNRVEECHLSSAFWLSIAMGGVLTGAFLLLSPLIAGFYRQSELRPIINVLALNFILGSLAVIPQALLTRAMDFRSLLIRDILAVVLSGALGIMMAWRGYGVWSLVFQQLSFTLLNGMFLWFFSPWRPRLSFSRKAVRELFHFSAHVTGFSIVNYLSRNIDYLLIGKFLGSQALGYYTLAYKLMLYPLQNFSWVLGKVMFPAFSRIQDDLEKVRSHFMRLIRAAALICFPSMGVLFIVAPELVLAVCGEPWLPAVPLIRLLCFAGMLQGISTNAGIIYMALGRVDIQMRMAALSMVLASVAITVGLQWGLTGVAACYLLYTFVMSHLTMWVMTREIDLGFSSFYGDLLGILVRSLGVFAAVFLFKEVFDLRSPAALASLVAAGGGLYALSVRGILAGDALLPENACGRMGSKPIFPKTPWKRLSDRLLRFTPSTKN